MPNQQADGSIIVDTELDTKGFKANSVEIKQAIESVKNTVKSTFNDIKQSVDRLNNTKIATQVEIVNIEQAESEIEELEKELKRLNNKKASLEGGKLGLGNFSKELAQLDASTAEMMKNAKTPQQRAGVEAIQSVEMDRLEEKYSSVISKQEEYNAKIKEAEARIQELKQGISATQLSEQAQATTADKVANAETRAANESTRGAAASKRNAKELSRGQIFANGLKNAFTKIHKVAGGLLSHFVSMRKHTGAIHGNIFKIGLAMLSIRSIWGGIRQVMSAALSSNQQLQNQLTAIKGIFGQAFLPIINTLINGLSYIVTLADRIYQIFSGVSLISKYNASQMKSVAGNTGAAAKNTKTLKKQLAGFDELNILNKNDTDSGSGADGGGTGNVATFELSKLSSKLADLINKLKELYREGDFEGIGVLIGTAINKGLQKISDAINWDNIDDKITEFVNAFTTAFNSLVDTVDWVLLGDTIAKGVNSLVNTLYLLFTQIEFSKCGQALGQSLNGLLHGVDWKKLGMTVSAAFRGALAYLINAVETFDWKGLGKAIVDFIQGIDWVGIISDLARLLGDVVIALCDIVIGFVETVDWGKAASDLFDSIVALFTSINWSQLAISLCELIGSLLGAGLNFIISWGLKAIAKFNEIASNIVDGFKNGITDELKQIGTWIKEHIFDPFINGFKNSFGIHSPSTKMAEMGGYIVDGLKNGIGNVWNKVKEKFTTFWTNLKGWFSGKATSLQNLGKNMITKIKTGLGNVWSTIKDKFTTFWTSLSGWFSGKATSLQNLGKNIISGIKTGINNKIGEIKTALTNGLSSALDSVKKLLGIHSPSRVFRDEVGQFIALGVGDGITSNISSVVKDAAKLSRAVSDEFRAADYQISTPHSIDIGSIGSSIDTHILSRLESIANGMCFNIPAAISVLPYKLKSDNTENRIDSKIEKFIDELINANIQIANNQTAELRAVIEALNLNVTVDSKSTTNEVIAEINRRIRVTGSNPLLT